VILQAVRQWHMSVRLVALHGVEIRPPVKGYGLIPDLEDPDPACYDVTLLELLGRD
jgi:hypothetical protein